MTARHFSFARVGGLVLAAVLATGGLICALRPTENLVPHQDPETTKIDWEYVGKSRARAYGVLSMVVAAGIVVLMFYPRQRPGKEGD